MPLGCSEKLGVHPHVVVIFIGCDLRDLGCIGSTRSQFSDSTRGMESRPHATGTQLSTAHSCAPQGQNPRGSWGGRNRMGSVCATCVHAQAVPMADLAAAFLGAVPQHGKHPGASCIMCANNLYHGQPSQGPHSRLCLINFFSFLLLSQSVICFGQDWKSLSWAYVVGGYT